MCPSDPRAGAVAKVQLARMGRLRGQDHARNVYV